MDSNSRIREYEKDQQKLEITFKAGSIYVEPAVRRFHSLDGTRGCLSFDEHTPVPDGWIEQKLFSRNYYLCKNDMTVALEHCQIHLLSNYFDIIKCDNIKNKCKYHYCHSNDKYIPISRLRLLKDTEVIDFIIALIEMNNEFYRENQENEKEMNEILYNSFKYANRFLINKLKSEPISASKIDILSVAV